MTWENSRTFCNDIGSNLASIHSETDFIEAKALCDGYAGCWIGLNDNKTEGIWQWDDKSITDYGFKNNSNTSPTIGIYPWSTDEPNNYNENEDCVHLDKNWDYEWNDLSCSGLQNPICNHPSQDTFSNPIDNIQEDTVYLIDQGRITGILSWGIWTTPGWIHYAAICKFSWSIDYQSTSTGDLIGSAGDFDDTYKRCDPFSLGLGDYINGYRVIYGTYIYGLYFYTKMNNTYKCSNESNIGKVYVDSGIIVYEDSYLSGFIFDAGWVMDGVQFQFTKINKSLTTTTSRPTQIPTINPSTTASISLPTSEPTSEPTNSHIDNNKTINSTAKPTRNPITLSPSANTGILRLFM